MGYNVVKEYAEKISGAKRVVERETMSELLSFVEANHIDKVLIYECSRLSRRVADFINIASPQPYNLHPRPQHLDHDHQKCDAR